MSQRPAEYARGFTLEVHHPAAIGESTPSLHGWPTAQFGPRITTVIRERIQSALPCEFEQPPTA